MSGLQLRISMFVRSLLASASAVLLRSGALAGGAVLRCGYPRRQNAFQHDKNLRVTLLSIRMVLLKCDFSALPSLRHVIYSPYSPVTTARFIQQGKIGLVKPKRNSCLYAWRYFCNADKTYTMENMGLGQAVMMVSVVSVEGMETVVMAQP